MRIHRKEVSRALNNRKNVTSESNSDTMGNSITLEIFPHPIPKEFLVSIIDNPKYYQLMMDMGRCVVYYDSPPDDSIQCGYYEVVKLDQSVSVIFTSLYGDYSVLTKDCFLTQELLYAYRHGIALQFAQTELLNSDNVIQELRAEAWNQMLISSKELL